MGSKDFSFNVLEMVVADLGSEFFTKDVSEDPRMTMHHFDLAVHSHYHAFVGKALSEYQGELDIRKIGYHHKRGSIWKKSMSEDETKQIDQAAILPTISAAPQHEDQRGMAGQYNLGPQYPQDNLLARRMRKHQSWYRANVLCLPYGTGPGPNDTNFYGNMLTRVDGQAGRNFLSPEIFEVVQDRIAQGGGAVEKYRLLQNMLSSQPMCFNLFGLLVKDSDLAKNVLETLVPEKISKVTRVDIEWSPIPAIDYLNDHTAFDAFIEYLTEDGQLNGLGIETKLSEPFSQKEYDRPEYRRWMQDSDAPWLPESENKVQAIGHNQLWREHLLAVAMHTLPGSAFNKVRFMLVYHPADIECKRNYSNYKKLLKDEDDTLFSLSLDEIVGRWLPVVKTDKQRNWLESFKKRYIDLELSEAYN